MVISAAARAAARIVAKASGVKKITKAKVRKHVGSIEKHKEIHHAKVIEKDAVKVDGKTGFNRDKEYQEGKYELERQAVNKDLEQYGPDYPFTKEEWAHDLARAKAGFRKSPAYKAGIRDPFEIDPSVSKHPIVSSFITMRGPAKAKPKGKVKLSIEKHTEREKTQQKFPEDPYAHLPDSAIDLQQREESRIKFSTLLYGKFRPGEEILATNVKTRLAKTPKHKLKYESAELKILFPEDIHFHPPQPSPRPHMSMKPDKHVMPPEISKVFGTKRAISYSKKRVSTKGDTETTKKKKYELEVYTTFTTDGPIKIIDKPPISNDGTSWIGFFLAYPRSGKWFGRKRIGISLTGKAQTKRTKGGKTVYQTQDHVAIDDAYFGVSFKPRDSVADKRLKGAGVFNNPSAELPDRGFGKWYGYGISLGKPRKLPEVVLEPWEQTMKPKVVKLPLPTRFEVATGVTVATGVSFAAIVGTTKHRKHGVDRKPRRNPFFRQPSGKLIP